MFTLTGTWDLVRTIGRHTVRGLAALEPRGLNRRAQQNAARAAAWTSAQRREAGEADRWLPDHSSEPLAARQVQG
ncbi:hypothetical protein [Streptacidiphilus sp. MAP5-3]|uniref:hypothetical protein n=1 Tax=unclassified Streptacidiphilus TaxID=2643834 RepID=UPI00351576AF